MTHHLLIAVTTGELVAVPAIADGLRKLPPENT